MSRTLKSCHAVEVDFSRRQDPPLFKKYGVMNSGLIEASRYNATIFGALAAMRVCCTHAALMEVTAFKMAVSLAQTAVWADAGTSLSPGRVCCGYQPHIVNCPLHVASQQACLMP